jgi:hypothetical protein
MGRTIAIGSTRIGLKPLPDDEDDEDEGAWEICHGDDWKHGSGSWDGEKWIPVRVVVSRWKTKNIPQSDNWVEFSGGSPNKGLAYFREQCMNHGINPRRLHQEEMNLSSGYMGREGEILMHDPVIMSSAMWRVERLDEIIQGLSPSLPIIHVVVNSDDYPAGSSGLDVFIKDRRLNSTLHLNRYGKFLGTFASESSTAAGVRRISATKVAACGDCAAVGEVTIKVNNLNKNDPHNYREIPSLGHRGYGRPVSISTLITRPPTDYVVFSTPDRSRLRMRISTVLDILKPSYRWRGVKIYPPLKK